MGRLRGGSLRKKKRSELMNPMEGVANLADVMLVLACGLMISVIAFWNIDIGTGQELVDVNQGADVTEVGSIADSVGVPDTSEGFDEVGIVYRDPQTGKMYMVVDEQGG